MITVRRELPADITAIRQINRATFGQFAEAEIVGALRSVSALTLSLIAQLDDRIVGHIAFSPVKIKSAGRITNAIGLAPMPVLPEYQKRGIGARLATEALGILQRLGHKVVIVVGHPSYYARFGFVSAHNHEIRCEYECPPEAFMLKELQDNALKGISGIVRFRPEFASV
ncbi:MAG: N-acetyltransferase [Desulfobacterales bacterium]|jgi:putative acetyltransferase